jgi:hypothetical protein
MRRAISVALAVGAMAGLPVAGALGAGTPHPVLFGADTDVESCGTSAIKVDYEIAYDQSLRGYGVSAALLSGLDEHCEGRDVVVSLDGPGGVPLAEMTAQVTSTRMRVGTPVGTPVAVEQLTGVSVVLRDGI